MTDKKRSKHSSTKPPTLTDDSLEDERHREMHPQSPAELARKVRAEASEGEDVVDKVKRGLEELDRDIAGEYERREDPTAPPAKPDARKR